jgi:PAS domain S-box-containing protein
MTGYPRRRSSGATAASCRARTPTGAVDRLRRASPEEDASRSRLVNHRRDGTPFVNEVHVAPVRDGEGRVVRFVGVQIDVTAYRAQERRFMLEQQAREKAEAAERRSSFLAAASPTLDATLDLRATLDSLTRLSVPHLADLSLVETVEGLHVRRVAASAADPSLERLLREADAVREIEPDGPDPLSRTLRQRRAEVVEETSDPVVGPAVHAVLARRLGAAPRQWMLVPLLARGRSIGVLALCSTDPSRSFGLEELALAEDLARRASLALDNARLYEQQVEIARVLQQSFLPDRLPDVPGLELVSRFRPADVAVEIGGDFYDVIQRPGGVTALAVGDVTGKGAGAAALTGLCRHTLRTAWLYEQRPERVLHALNRVLVAERRERGRYATAALCVLTPTPDGIALEVACGGHPAPRILREDGRVDVVGARGTILGWREDLEIEPVAGHLAPGDTLVLFTDGRELGQRERPAHRGRPRRGARGLRGPRADHRRLAAADRRAARPERPPGRRRGHRGGARGAARLARPWPRRSGAAARSGRRGARPRLSASASAARTAWRSVGRGARVDEAREAELARLGQAAVAVADRPQLAREADLAEAGHGQGGALPAERVLRAALATASATARSAPGSSTRTPPTTLTKTSCVPVPTPAWRASTARTSARRLRSMPLTTRRGGTSSEADTSACTSTSSGGCPPSPRGRRSRACPSPPPRSGRRRPAPPRARPRASRRRRPRSSSRSGS